MSLRIDGHDGLTGPPRWTPATVAAIYFTVSSAYILLSDLVLMPDEFQATGAWMIGVSKGLLFVVATTLLLHVLLSRRHAEIARRERFLSAILEGTDAAIFVVDSARRIVAANPSAERIFGHPRGALRGASTRILHVSDRSWEDFHHHGWPLLDAGRPFTCDYRMRRADGTEFLASINVSLVTFPDGQHMAVSILTDVTAERTREEELRRSQALLRQLVEHIDNVFWLSTPDTSKILYVSPAFEHIWGQETEALYGDPMAFTRAVHPEDRERVRSFVEHQPVRDQTVEYRIVRPGGEVRWIRDRSFRILDEGGTVYRCAGIAEDITEEKERQRQLLAAQKREALGQIAGGVAHDFNNMLLVIMGNLEAALDTEADPRRRTTLETALRAGERGAELAARLLAFGRADHLQPVPTDLADAIREAEAIVSRAVGARIRMEIRARHGLPLVEVDRGQFENAVLNLALNARDAMPKGGTLTFAVAAPGRGGGGAGEVHVSITDTGCGMDEDVLARAAEPFFTTKAGKGGSGLGLSSVQAFLRQCGGRMTLRSRPGEGTTVTLIFPAASGDAPGADGGSRPGRAGERRGARSVLVAEGDPLVAETIREMIERLGCRAVLARSAEGALSAIRGERDVDVVLADLQIPGRYDGRDLAHRLRDERPDLRIWLMTGQPESALPAPEVLPEGVRLLMKPLRRDTLQKIL
ncbi:PAS domain S-box protein [Futiania mangrovi]|uniref:histidine kinase n=1 Tax=Futiania mangrovi TaxID=2959716 RepID=A0A9J6PG11_9PROT|nr:hybrid sensor histidine kinase/response regulator [Futiania mangrovii]MCP1335551.1 PAS domain S-box protein [Futiania mangrovii]